MSKDVEYADLITLNPTHDDVARIGNMIENYIKGLDDRTREAYEDNLSHCFVNFDVGVMTALLSEPADPNSITLLIATRYKALLDRILDVIDHKLATETLMAQSMQKSAEIFGLKSDANRLRERIAILHANMSPDDARLKIEQQEIRIRELQDYITEITNKARNALWFDLGLSGA